MRNGSFSSRFDNRAVSVAVRLCGVGLTVGALIALDSALTSILQAARIRLPASVVGMLGIFGVLIALESVAPRLAPRVIALFSPGAGFLRRWLALFFVPPLVALQRVALPAPRDLWGVALIISLGFVFTLITTALLVRVLSERRGSVRAPSTASRPSRSGGGFLLVGWLAATAVCGALWLYTRHPAAARIFFLAVTITAFVAGGRLQGVLTLWLRPGARALAARALIGLAHPIVVAAVVTIGALALFEHPVEAYLTGGIGAAGAGDLLMLLLNPAVSALGFLLFEERHMLRDHAVEIVTALVPAALLALLSAAAAAGALRLSREYALAVIPRSVTTPIAIPIAETLGANPGITAALVVITGLLGAIFGPALLDRLGFTSPVIRGVAIGASSHGIGAAALVATDPPAAAISGIAFALMATISAAAVSIEPICLALIRLAGGP